MTLWEFVLKSWVINKEFSSSEKKLKFLSVLCDLSGPTNIHLVALSLAFSFPLCMYIVKFSKKNQRLRLWLSALFLYLVSFCWNFTLQRPAASASMNADLGFFHLLRPLSFAQDPCPCSAIQIPPLGRKLESLGDHPAHLVCFPSSRNHRLALLLFST